MSHTLIIRLGGWVIHWLFDWIAESYTDYYCFANSLRKTLSSKDISYLWGIWNHEQECNCVKCFKNTSYTLVWYHTITSHKIYVYWGTTSSVYFICNPKYTNQDWHQRTQRLARAKGQLIRKVSNVNEISSRNRSSGGTYLVWSFDAFSSTQDKG